MKNLPGGELAYRPLYFFWIADCSGSMTGEKIASLNYAIKSIIPSMQKAAENNPNAKLFIRALKFSSGAQWITSDPVEINNYDWEDLSANGVTDMGKAFDLLADQLKMPPMPERALPPVLVLLSDGQPTDDYKDSLANLLSLPWGKKAVKVAVSIGDDALLDMLSEFTQNKELVLNAKNSNDLVTMIKWASTLAQLVSSPKSSPVGGNQVVIDTNSIPKSSDDGEIW
ncbi:MAG: VWA domain-containing protein [Bacteroidetes bacterium]|nr:VWA domain-containing protein [Bacteroidota bacterium]